jgi:hypothetical protein
MFMNNMKKRYCIILMPFMLLLLSCNNDDFSPIKGNEKYPVAYCLFDTRAKEQIVLIQCSYLSDTAKFETEMIKVTLKENSDAPKRLRDTIIPGMTNYIGYYLPGFKIKRNSSYRLTVECDEKVQYTDVFVPQRAAIDITMKYNSGAFSFNASVSRSAPSINAIRIFIDYEKNTKGTIFRDTIQLPVYSNILNKITDINRTDFSSFEPVDLSYSNFSNGWNSTYFKFSGNFCNVNLPLSYWLYIFSKIREGTSIGDITIKGAFAVFYTIDNFYYENFLRVYLEEPYVVRLDAPYIPTNFKSFNNRPIGYFSVLTADTTKFRIDSVLIFNNYFRDGQ